MKIENIAKLMLEELKNTQNKSVKGFEISENLSQEDQSEDTNLKDNKFNIEIESLEETLQDKDKDEIEKQILNAVNNYFKNDEIKFLLGIKERILVLFESLSAFDKGDIEARVELNLKFMEFLLASIENRLENLSK